MKIQNYNAKAARPQFRTILLHNLHTFDKIHASIDFFFHISCKNGRNPLLPQVLISQHNLKQFRLNEKL